MFFKKIQYAFILTGFITTFPASALPKSDTTCKTEAIKEAKKLLSFYRDNDERIFIENKATPLTKMVNPKNKKQIFDVLQVWGGIYKGEYRMRFIFSSKDECTLMGEEILEYAIL